MSNISRRDFLKTAGVMTLAVAAAGVLAGCEGNAAKPEVPVVTTNTVTANNYTLTLKDTKQFAVKTHDKDGAVTAEDRYVVALLNLKVVDDSKALAADKPFVLLDKSNNMDVETVVDGTTDKVSPACLKKLFDLKKDPEAITSFAPTGADISGFAKDTKPSAGVDRVVVYKVKKVEVVTDKEWEFKAPTLSFVVQDKTGLTYTKFDAVIPAAVDVKKADLLG